VDGCGVVRWAASAPGNGRFLAPTLALPGGDIVATEGDRSGAGDARLLVLSGRDGRPLAGPVGTRGLGTAVAVGADGTVYALSCLPGRDGNAAPPTVTAHGADLRVLWSVALDRPGGNPACPERGVALDDDGVMYLVRTQHATGPGTRAGIVVMALQTTSPGVSAAGWPLVRHDNQGSGWAPAQPGR
jgi:hypothetical protein